MARGFLSGAIWGTVMSVGALGTLSVLDKDQVDRREVLAEAVRELTRDSAAESGAPTEEPAEVQSDDIAAAAPSVPDENDVGAADAPPADPPTDDAGPSDQATTDVSPQTEQPSPDTSEDQTASVEDTSEPARRPTDVEGVVTDVDTPVLETPTPTEDTAPEDIAAAPKPAPEAGDGVAQLNAPSESDAPDVKIASLPDSAPDAPAASSLSAPQSEVGLSISTEPAQPPTPSVPTAESALAPEVESSPDVQDTPTTDPTASDPAPDAAPERPAVRVLVPEPAEPADATVETAAAARPTVGRPAGTLTDRNKAANRLPTIGSASATEARAAGTESAADTGLALTQYSVPTASDPNLPKMAIVLIDDGTGPLGPDTIDTFPFPVTFALDPTQANATDRMAAYRALGYEVASLVNVPQSAQPTDVEQILAGSIAVLPETVAFVEAPGSGLQSARGNTEQASRFAAESGHGLVFLPNGLNTAQAIAQREDVPATSVLRDFDGDGQDARTKRRFLDGAAFRARQDGAAVMLGRLTPDTVSALVLWSLQDRASSVAMVPVSAILIGTPE